MKTILLATGGMLLYALQSFLFENRLSKYTTPTLMVYLYLAMLPLALLSVGYMSFHKQPIVAPSGNAILLVVAIGVMYFVADYLYFTAYTSGGNLYVIATIAAMFPVFASIIKFVATKEPPNLYQLGAYILALCSVLLVSKGNP
ncbi:MAG: EamA family transporter [Candidatus Komeilibacteria bacterium]